MEMKNYLNLVPISVKVHRRQSKMTRICITLAIFLVAVMFGLADVYLQGVIQKQIWESGDWHYQFHSIDTQTAASISARPEVEVSGWHNTISPEAGYSLGGNPVAVSAQDKNIFESIFLNSVTEGKYPGAENEIAVSSSLKDSASLFLNETIELFCPDGSRVSYLVVGFFDDKETSRLGVEGAKAVVLTQEGSAALAASAKASATERFVVRFSRDCNIPDSIAAIKEQNNVSDEQMTGNLSLLSIEGQLEGETGINQIYQIALILSAIVMLSCILMISSSLNSNVAQRTEFFGMLRCLGMTKKQIMRYVRYEGIYWCKTAIPLGIILSILVVWILSAAMRAFSPEWFSCIPLLAVSWISIAASALSGLVTVLLAARSPAKRAAKVSPLTAASGNAGETASFCKSAKTNRFKIETSLGIYHAKVRKRNYILMTGSFAVCITLFLMFSTLVAFMENAFMPPAYIPELSIASESNTCSIDNELLELVNQNGAVKRAYGRMFAYDIPAEQKGRNYNINVISYEENQFKWAAEELISGSLDPVMQQENQVLFVRTDHTDVGVGDSITLFINNMEYEVTVAGILSDSPLARVSGTETVFCSEKTFTALTGQTDYTIIDVQFRNHASGENVNEIENIFKSDSVVFQNKLSEVRQQRNLYYAFSVLVYGFLSVIVAITTFHIMNTINMGVAARMKEYGAMRAIGMSNRQLVKMIMAEAGTYAVSGVILGCMTGLPMHRVVFVSLITNFWGMMWSIPVVPLALIIAIVLFSSFLAVLEPARRLHTLSVVENIHTQ